MKGSTKQRANRVDFGLKYGKGRSNADAQMKRETKRLEQYHSKKK